MNIKKFAEKIAELHYPNKPNAIIDEPYRKVRMKTLVEQIEREFEILNLAGVVGQSEQLNFVPKKGDKVIAWEDTYCEVVEVRKNYVICRYSKLFSFMIDAGKLRLQKI